MRGFERPFEITIGDPFFIQYHFFLFCPFSTSRGLLVLEKLIRSPFGRLLRAIREDEVAAQSLGKPPNKIRLTAFVVGSMIMGLAGGLYATFYAFVSPQDVLPTLTFQIWAMLIVGGSGNNQGGILGAFLIWAAWTASGWISQNLLLLKLNSTRDLAIHYDRHDYCGNASLATARTYCQKSLSCRNRKMTHFPIC